MKDVIPKSPVFRPSIPAKTGTVPVPVEPSGNQGRQPIAAGLAPRHFVLSPRHLNIRNPRPSRLSGVHEQKFLFSFFALGLDDFRLGDIKFTRSLPPSLARFLRPEKEEVLLVESLAKFAHLAGVSI